MPNKFEKMIRIGLKKAIQHYWLTRTGQLSPERDGGEVRDQGRRAEVTGGKQLDGFLWVIRDLLEDGGIPHPEVFTGQLDSYLPGYFRPTKRWDLLVIADGYLLACIEIKSQAGSSYGNNFNNRIEEAIGNAHDFWRAYQVKAFRAAIKPFLGYIMLLEDDAASTRPVKLNEPHFKVLPEFQESSYCRRYQIFCEKAFREGLYDATALLMSNKDDGLKGEYIEPSPDLTFKRLAAAIYGRAVAYSKERGR
jgi:Restriction endonuclease XhoI